MDEAKKLKMEAWLYDEDRWPSGAAGGLVTKKPSCRNRMLRFVECDDPAAFRWTPATLAAFTAVVKGNVAYSVRPIPKGGRPPRLAKGEKILAFQAEHRRAEQLVQRLDLLDMLNPEAVREFIRVTHEAYRRECGRAFGNLVPGIFSDEPNSGTAYASTAAESARLARSPGPTRCRKSSASDTATICCRTCRNSATISRAQRVGRRATISSTASRTSS